MLLVAGCASGGSNAQPGNQLTTVPTTAPTTTPVAPATGPAIPGVHLPAGATPVAGKQVVVTSLPSTFPRTVWTENGGAVLGFYGESGGCFTSNATVVQQTDSQVIVRLVQQEPGTGSHMCPMYLRYKPMTVALAKPLGDRTVVLQLSIVRG